jgi:hypothetical protein
MAPSIGFEAQLRDQDIVISQNTDAGAAAIWLTRHEATRLVEFIQSLDGGFGPAAANPPRVSEELPA